MKKLVASFAIVGISAVGFAGSASAVPTTSSGTVPTICAIQNVTPGVLGPNRTNPNELSTKYTGGIPASVNIICNTTTSTVTLTPNVAASRIPPGGFLEYQLRNTNGSTGIYAALNTANFKQPEQASYTTPPAGARTSSRGDILRIDTEVVAATGTVIPPGTYSAVVDVTLAP